MDGEEHQTKVQNNKKDAEHKPFWIQTMLKVMKGMFHEDWKILEKATFESTIVITVNGNVYDSTEVEDTENEVEKNLPFSRNDIK